MTYKKKLFILSLLVLSLVIEAVAHDCFLMAKPFRPSAGEPVMVAIHIHDDFPGKHVAWNLDRILRFHHWHGGSLVESASPSPLPDSSGVIIRPSQPGVHLIAVDWAPRLITIEAEKFTEYLRSEGLNHIIRAREVQQQQAKPGRERYSRYIKTFVYAGEGNDRAVRTVVGQTIELTPLDNPYAQSVGDTVRFQLLFQGKPLSGALVSATHAGTEKRAHKYAQSARTNREGIVSFRLTHNGAWLVRTVYMLPAVDDPEVEWESWWASVTFDVQ